MGFIKQDLRVQPLSAKVKTSGVTAGDDGFYYRKGETVMITADGTVGLKTNSGESIGILQTGLSTTSRPGGLDARDRVNVNTPYNFLMEVTAEGELTAGQNVTDGTVVAGSFKVAGEGDKIKGVVFVGAADTKTAQILM